LRPGKKARGPEPFRAGRAPAPEMRVKAIGSRHGPPMASSRTNGYLESAIFWTFSLILNSTIRSSHQILTIADPTTTIKIPLMKLPKVMPPMPNPNIRPETDDHDHEKQ